MDIHYKEFFTEDQFEILKNHIVVIRTNLCALGDIDEIEIFVACRAAFNLAENYVNLIPYSPLTIEDAISNIVFDADSRDLLRAEIGKGLEYYYAILDCTQKGDVQ